MSMIRSLLDKIEELEAQIKSWEESTKIGLEPLSYANAKIAELEATVEAWQGFGALKDAEIADAKKQALELAAQNEAMRKALRYLLTLSESADETGYVEGEGWLPMDRIQGDARHALSITPSSALQAHDLEVAEAVTRLALRAYNDPAQFTKRNHACGESVSDWCARAVNTAVRVSLEGK